MKVKSRKRIALSMCILLLVSLFAGCAQQGAPGPSGPQGQAGKDGENGENGKSAYELAVENGYTGSAEEWLESLVGETGSAGRVGESAYELAVKKGYQGTEEEWLESLVGQAGANGKSAYELAVENGFQGSLSQWLNSLVGKNGVNGLNGANGVNGTNGKSAYELACEAGFEGTLTEWLASLVGKGDTGAQGEKGDKGEKGDTGVQGEKGDKGDQGDDGVDGISPQLRINSTTKMWEVSYDNGVTWKSLDVLATGNKGDTGDKGDKGDQGDTGANGITPQLRVNDTTNMWEVSYDEGNTWLSLDVIATGAQGEKGDKGDTGVGIADVSIDYMGHVAITLTNGQNITIDVTHPTCEHNFGEVVISPTCLEPGCTKYTCSKCGYIYRNDYSPATGHHFADGECVFCHQQAPYGELTPDTSWYENGNYSITTREQLAGLGYLVKNGITFSGTTISLGNNIDLGSVEWEPIGTSTHPFAGTFDGKGLTVSNLKITSTASYVGLFGYVTGTLKNLTVANADVTVTGVNSYVAIACGYSTGNLSGITTSGYVNAANCSHVGGVAGCLMYTKAYNIYECSNSGDIIGSDYTGGIVGQLHITKGTANNISNCQNSGKVTGGNYTAGIIGNCKSTYDTSAVVITINDVTNSGAITGKNYCAGLFGYLYAYSGTLTGGTNTGAITATGTYGDIVAYNKNITIN